MIDSATRGALALVVAAACFAAAKSPTTSAQKKGERREGTGDSTAFLKRGPRTGRPNIVLITVDALRADRLGVYGYTRPTSPAIDAFAREAVIVTDAIAQAPYTKASIGSLFTGLFPTAHKAHTTALPVSALMDGAADGDTPEMSDVLSAKLDTLAEALAAAGYRTYGFSTNPFLIPDFGFAQGFERFQFFADGTAYAAARSVLPAALAAIDARDPRPFFVWIHLMEPHNPYAPPEPFRSMFPPAAPPRVIDSKLIPPWLSIDGSRDLNLYSARYDAEIRTVDAALEQFWNALKGRGLWDDTVVALTSDHGEEFMEHGGLEHNTSLYDEQLRVPLIVRVPGLAPRRVRAQAQLVDLYPTLAALAGARTPEDLHGGDLRPVLAGDTVGEPYAYAEIVGRRFAVRTVEWKLISSLQGGRQLFDLTTDPGEQENLARVQPQRAADYEKILARMLATAIRAGNRLEGESIPISPIVRERLRALGYLGGS